MAPGVSSCHYCDVPPSISFSGSGFMATYQLGVAQCLLNYTPWIVRTAPCVLGASAGSLVATAVVCEMNLSTIRDEMLNLAKQTKAFTLGPFNPSINVFHWLESILHKHLPSNAHQLASGRLAVAMTRMSDRKLIIMSEFHSRVDVMQALLCSCFVPGYCGMLPPSYKGVHYVDGGFSSMQPLLPSSCNHILTVSPFSGEMDICPADEPCMWEMVVNGTTLKGNMANSFRILNALYPIALETLEQAYDSGYKDAIHFLLSNNLAPHLMMHKLSQGLINYNQTETLMYMKTTTEEKTEMKVERETLTSCTDSSCMPTESFTEFESSSNQPFEERPLHFDAVKNVLLGNVVTYLSMFGLPARILSHLLLPLMLSFYAVLQSRHSVGVLVRHVPEWVFWTWHGLRHLTFFFFNILVCSFKKNINDRVMSVILLLQWLNIQAQDKAPQGQRRTTPYHKFPARHGSLHRPHITPSQDCKEPQN